MRPLYKRKWVVYAKPPFGGPEQVLKYFARYPFTKDITFGVVDVHTHAIEDVELIKSRIELALKYLPKEAVWIDPDCGLKTRTVDESKNKLANIQTAVEAVRAGL